MDILEFGGDSARSPARDASHDHGGFRTSLFIPRPYIPTLSQWAHYWTAHVMRYRIMPFSELDDVHTAVMDNEAGFRVIGTMH